MKKIKGFALLFFTFASMTSVYAMVVRRVVTPQTTQSFFSRITYKISNWKNQFVRWYNQKRLSANSRVVIPQLKVVVPETKSYYSGPKYDRTEDWIEQDPFGQRIAKALKSSNHTNQGKRVYKVIEDIESCDGFKKGDFIVVDALHKDHLEVFDKHGKWIGAANFDGTKNREKTERGKKGFRGELE